MILVINFPQIKNRNNIISATNYNVEMTIRYLIYH
jgi:hypothetical protein